MSIDSLTSYNPNNVNDTLYAYQSNRTVATNPIQQALRTNYASTVSLDTPPDTFELSAESKIKNNKDKGMSTGMKALLWIGGTAAAVYGAVVGHRALTKPTLEKVAKNFSEIFRRDISKEEAQKLVNNYKELLNIEDTEEFIKKAFEQVKKDYGYENVPIKLNINKLNIYEESGNAAWISNKGILELNILTDKITGKTFNTNKRGRKHILQTIIHEFQHTKQDEFAYRTSRDKFAESMHYRMSNVQEHILDMKQTLSKKSELEKLAKAKNMTIEECKKYFEEKIKEIENSNIVSVADFNKNEKIALDELFKNFSKFAESSKEYELGQKYIHNNRHYIRSRIDPKGYKKQILESEASGAEDKFDEIYNSFANIWRIPFFM